MVKKTKYFLLLVLATANCFGQILTSVDERSTKRKIDANNTAPIVVTVIDDRLYEFKEQKLGKDKLLIQLDALLDLRSPETRTIYIRADGKTSFARLAELMRMGRKLDVDNFAFLADNVSSPIEATKLKIVLEDPPKLEPKPWARFLVVEILKGDKLLLNRKPVSETQLIGLLTQVFSDRKKNRVYVVGSNDVDKTVFIKPLLSTKFESVVALVNTISNVGAGPIAITIDWLKP
jgi:biopolymer transport protein ExbD